MTVWFITGAARGFGIEITRQALDRGDQVVATARHPEAITQAVPDAGDPAPRARPASGRNRPTTLSPATRPRPRR
jgi:NAD(P)-dependent dehydrogenase (short-subunit alcohol dehydrogenase family)